VTVPYPKPLIETAAPLVWLRERARAAYGVAPSGSTRRRLFLSRVADGHFRALNEAELLAGLADLHFEIVRPGQLTFAEQVAFFSEAECIVGTGTGLANMIFAPPGAHIVQWQDPTHIVQSLWTLAEALGHTYHTFNAEPVPSEVPGLNNLRVPLDKLRASLAALN
jgi:capsular polysaccharide biosynthesis protein